MTRTYECMFLLDNEVVRAGWNDAKSSIASLVKKHGGQVVTSRRWGERRLTYPIRHRNRATYLLAYCELPPAGAGGLRRELDISETVLRYLILSSEGVPAAERELSAAEQAPDFEMPEPPEDDAIDHSPSAEQDDSSDVSDDDDDDDSREPVGAAALDSEED